MYTLNIKHNLTSLRTQRYNNSNIAAYSIFTYIQHTFDMVYVYIIRYTHLVWNWNYDTNNNSTRVFFTFASSFDCSHTPAQPNTTQHSPIWHPHSILTLTYQQHNEAVFSIKCLSTLYHFTACLITFQVFHEWNGYDTIQFSFRGRSGENVEFNAHAISGLGRLGYLLALCKCVCFGGLNLSSIPPSIRGIWKHLIPNMPSVLFILNLSINESKWITCVLWLLLAQGIN